MKKNHGAVSVPLVLGLVLLLAALVAVWQLGTGKKEAAPSEETGTSTTQETTRKSRLIWEAGLSGVLLQALQPNADYAQAISLDSPLSTIKVVTSSEEVVPELTAAAGTNPTDFAVTKTSLTDPVTGEVATIYQIASNSDTSTESTWQLIVSNESDSGTGSFNVGVSNSDNIEVETGSGNSGQDDSSGEDPSTGDDDPAVVGGNATLTITIQETIDLNVTLPIVGASVIAIITSPSGQVFTVNLIEVSPGVYSGVFSNITEPGIYHVTYVISGQNSDGDHFDQTVDDTFEVTEGDLDGNNGGDDPTYESSKVFDINQADEVRLKQGGDY